MEKNWQKYFENRMWISVSASDDVEWNHLSCLVTKPTKWHVRPAKTQISLGIRPVWSESLLSAWRKLGSLATDWAHSEDSDQTGRMPRLIWVFPGRTVTLLALSWGGSFVKVSTAQPLYNTVVRVQFPCWFDIESKMHRLYRNRNF